MHDGDAGTVTFFAISRNGSEPLEIDLSLERFGAAKSERHTLIRHDDLEARNTRDAPETLVPRDGHRAAIDGDRLTVTQPPYSYTMVRVEL